MKAAGADAFDVLTTVSWEDRSWWNGALNRGSVLDYFANSQFFDRASVNAQLRMQGSMLPPEVAREQLARLPGIVFELDETRLEELPPTASDPAARRAERRRRCATITSWMASCMRRPRSGQSCRRASDGWAGT